VAFDERLALRVRAVLADRDDVEERRMFGGLTFMVAGHMAVGVVGEDLMVRVGPAGFQDALARPHVRPMDFTGRPSRSAVYVAPAGVVDDGDLAVWVGRGVSNATG
jgi:TfoX/Sxy family transcriptional regulator of competence genes